MIRKIAAMLILGLLVITILPLNTIGENNDQTGVKVYEDGCCKGYTLCSVVNYRQVSDSNALLIDMDGNEINKWFTFPAPAKMLPGGSIIAFNGIKYMTWSEGNLSQMDWDGNVEWTYYWDKTISPHHDFQREGNPVGYYAPGQDFLSYGKTLVLVNKKIHNENVSRKTIIDDVIYEVNWDGSSTDFEWCASEHIDEMGLDLKARIGIWLNPGGSGSILGLDRGDWLHINSVSYLGKNHWYDEDPINYSYFNPENIIIDSRNANFIAIISKETGDIVWRIGPDYSQRTTEGRKLSRIIGLHNAHMIPDGLPGAGNILVFDNGGIAGYGLFGFPNQFRFYSRVLEFNPITLEIVQEYTHKKGLNVFPRYGEFHKFFSYTLSSVQRLPNGNTLVTEGFSGRIFELTPENKIVWEFVTPAGLHIYRAYRVPPEWVPGNPADYPFWED